MGDREMVITMYRGNPAIQGAIHTGDWTHGICGCFDNIGMCLIAYFLPCVTWGETASELGKSCCLYGGCLYFIPFVNCHLIAAQRGEIRDIRGIPGSYCGDCVMCACCSLCALVQERQEVTEIRNDILRRLAMSQRVVVTTGIPVVAVQTGAYPPQAAVYPALNTDGKPYPYNPHYEEQKVDRV